jgi:hypothetical protein
VIVEDLGGVIIHSPHQNKFPTLKIFETENPIFGTPETAPLEVGKYSDSQPKYFFLNFNLFGYAPDGVRFLTDIIYFSTLPD